MSSATTRLSQVALSPEPAPVPASRSHALRQAVKFLTTLGYIVGALALGVIVWELIILVTGAQSYILPTPLSSPGQIDHNSSIRIPLSASIRSIASVASPTGRVEVSSVSSLASGGW